MYSNDSRGVNIRFVSEDLPICQQRSDGAASFRAMWFREERERNVAGYRGTTQRTLPPGRIRRLAEKRPSVYRVAEPVTSSMTQRSTSPSMTGLISCPCG